MSDDGAALAWAVEDEGKPGWQLQQYLWWAGAGSFAGAVAALFFYYLYPTPLTLVLSVAVFAIGTCQGIAYRVAGSGRTERAIIYECAGLWIISIA